jgi:TolB protein
MQAGVDGVSRVVRVGVGPDNKVADSAQLTADVAGDSAFPALSPDGKMVAYQFKPKDGQFQIYVMNIDGSNKRMVSDGTGVASLPAWSPDNKSIAYVQGAEQTAGSVKEIWTTAVEAGTPQKITNTGVALTYPTWSPDGKSIASAQVVSERDYKLLIMDGNGANPRTLDEGVIIRWPLFSPSGDALLYYTISGVGNDINIYDLKSDRHSSPTKNQGDNYQPVWSPDGTMIAWANQPGGSSGHKIVTANRDGSNRRIVTSGGGDDSQPVWGRPAEK